MSIYLCRFFTDVWEDQGSLWGSEKRIFYHCLHPHHPHCIAELPYMVMHIPFLVSSCIICHLKQAIHYRSTKVGLAGPAIAGSKFESKSTHIRLCMARILAGQSEIVKYTIQNIPDSVQASVWLYPNIFFKVLSEAKFAGSPDPSLYAFKLFCAYQTYANLCSII